MRIMRIAVGLLLLIGFVSSFDTDAVAQANLNNRVACNAPSVAADAYAGLIIMNMDRPSLWTSSDGGQKDDLLVAALDYYLLIWENCKHGLVASDETFARAEEIAQELREWVEQQKREGGNAP